MKLGPTGKFPWTLLRRHRGKLVQDDEGELRMGVSTFNGNVVVVFATPVGMIAMPPDDADRFAEVLQEHAAELRRGGGRDGTGPI